MSNFGVWSQRTWPCLPGIKSGLAKAICLVAWGSASWHTTSCKKCDHSSQDAFWEKFCLTAHKPIVCNTHIYVYFETKTYVYISISVTIWICVSLTGSNSLAVFRLGLLIKDYFSPTYPRIIIIMITCTGKVISKTVFELFYSKLKLPDFLLKYYSSLKWIFWVNITRLLIGWDLLECL